MVANDEEHSSWNILKSRSPTVYIIEVHFCFKQMQASVAACIENRRSKHSGQEFIPGSEADSSPYFFSFS